MPRWNVRLFEVQESAPPDVDPRFWKAPPPAELAGYSIDASMVDDALRVARDWLVERGHKVRSISALRPIEDRTLSAVILVSGKKEG